MNPITVINVGGACALCRGCDVTTVEGSSSMVILLVVKTVLRSGVAGAVLALLATTAVAQSTYQVVDVDRLTSTGSYFSYAYGLNESNQVVGFTYVVTGYRAFLYEPGTGVLLNLGDLNGGNDFSIARGVNNSGVVVGWSSGAVLVGGLWTTLNRVFMWSSGGGITDLGADVYPTGHSYAYDVNDLGWVVGNHPPAGVSTFTRRGFLWQPGGAVTFLPFLDPTGLPSTEAHAVTNTGVVVGDSSGNAGQHAFQWDTINGIRAIPGDTTAASRACDVNESGTVVGRAVIDDGMGGFEIPGLVLGGGQLTLIDVPAGAVRLGAEAVNAHGEVVGWMRFENHSICLGGGFPTDPSCYSDLHTDRAFVWTAGGGLVDLTSQVDPADPLAGGVVITSAYDINDRGFIAANGFISGQTGQHAFLLIPSIFSDDFESSDTSHWSAVQP
jgi:uncharacterized membrane protein